MADRNLSKYDLTARVFGRLTVLRLESHGKHRFWRCRCECGNEKVVRDSHLKQGDTVSCGCYHSEMKRARAQDFTGQRFGKLIVVARVRISDWERKTGINESTIRARLKRGWSVEATLTTPIKPR